MSVSDSDDPAPPVMSPTRRRGRAARIVPVDEGSEEEPADQPDVDDDDEDEDGVEDEDAEGEEEEEEEEEDVDLEDDEGAVDVEDVEVPPSTTNKKSAGSARMPLKIKLKMPSTSSSSPAVGEDDGDAPESEDEDAEGEDDDDETMPGPSKSRPLTARQAALAGGTEHTNELETLETANSSRRKKKKDLNDVELALKKEEMARKRKNLSEKRAQDEQNETINRLLRRQSSRRNKRNALATAEDREVGSGSDEEGEDVPEYIPEAPPPTMYRWVSSSRSTEDGVTPTMVMSFGVPQAVDVAAHEAHIQEAAAHAELLKKPAQQPSLCGIDGCTKPRKYRLVKDWTTGACGLPHLKMLEGRA